MSERKDRLPTNLNGSKIPIEFEARGVGNTTPGCIAITINHRDGTRVTYGVQIRPRQETVEQKIRFIVQREPTNNK